MMTRELQIKLWHVALYTALQLGGAGYYFGRQGQLIQSIDARQGRAEVQIKALELTVNEIQSTRFRREEGDRVVAQATQNAKDIAVATSQVEDMKRDIEMANAKLDKILDRLQ